MTDTSRIGPHQSIEEIAATLAADAERRWGHDRAEALRPVIEETAAHIWRVSQSEVAPEDEPDFYPQ